MPRRVWKIGLIVSLTFAVCTTGLAQRSEEKIAFTSYEDGKGEIFLMEGKNGKLIQLTRNNVRDYQPALSPDGERIAFVSDVESRGDILVLDIEDGKAQKLTQTVPGETFSHPDWSPDGKRISCIHNDALYVMNDRGENLVRIAEIEDVPTTRCSPDWSPDGKSILFAELRNSYRIIAVDVESGQTTRIIGSGNESGYSPIWSPDGRQIAFVRRPGIMSFSDIYVMDTDGENVRQLTDSSARDSEPVWSLDGTKIAFVREDSNGQRDIYVMNADGSDVQNVTNSARTALYPDWSPDSRKLVFVSTEKSLTTILVIDADGKNCHKLIQTFGVYSYPDWLPDGRIAFVSYEDGGVYTVDADGDNRELLIDNEGELKMRFPVWSPDGEKLAYWLDIADNSTHGLYVSDFDGENKEHIVDVGSLYYTKHPSWSPDGKKLTVSFRSEEGRYLVHVVDVESGDLACLGDANSFVRQEEPSFSPDGRKIAFSGEQERTDWIYIMGADGSDTRAIGPVRLSGFVTGMTWAPGGSQILFSGYKDSEYVIHRMDTQTGRSGEWYKNAEYPDWVDPSRSSFNIEPRGKRLTTWGKMKRTSVE